jgi:hypothetical protein
MASSSSKRKSRPDRTRGKLKQIKEEMRRRMHQPIPDQALAAMPRRRRA